MLARASFLCVCRGLMHTILQSPHASRKQRRSAGGRTAAAKAGQGLPCQWRAERCSTLELTATDEWAVCRQSASWEIGRGRMYRHRPGRCCLCSLCLLSLQVFLQLLSIPCKEDEKGPLQPGHRASGGWLVGVGGERDSERTRVNEWGDGRR